MKLPINLLYEFLSKSEQIDAQEFCLTIGKTLLASLQADQCLFLTTDPETEELHTLWSINRNGISSDETVRVRKGRGIAGRVASDYKPLLIENASTDPIYLEEIDKKKSSPEKKQIWALPIISFGQFCGVLEIINRGPRKFLPSDLEFIQPLIELIALAHKREETDALAKLAEVCIRFLEERDRYTYGHSLRVSEYCMILAEELGLPLDQKKELRLCALLHDIGKVTLKDSILSLESPLSPIDRKVVQMHSIIGANIISSISKKIASRLLSHHEHYDGKGYPNGLKGEQIPLCARIICLADSIDAMLSNRPYRPPLEIDQVIKEVITQSGKQFDPKIVDVFLKLYRSGKLNLIEVQK